MHQYKYRLYGYKINIKNNNNSNSFYFLEQLHYYDMNSYYFSVVKLFMRKIKIFNIIDELLYKLPWRMSTIYTSYYEVILNFKIKSTLRQYIFNKIYYGLMTSYIVEQQNC